MFFSFVWNTFKDVSNYSICLNKTTFKSSPSNDRHSYAKNNHATKSSQPSQVESVASQHIGRGLNLSAGVETSKSESFMRKFQCFKQFDIISDYDYDHHYASEMSSRTAVTLYF